MTARKSFRTVRKWNRAAPHAGTENSLPVAPAGTEIGWFGAREHQSCSAFTEGRVVVIRSLRRSARDGLRLLLADATMSVSQRLYVERQRHAHRNAEDGLGPEGRRLAREWRRIGHCRWRLGTGRCGRRGRPADAVVAGRVATYPEDVRRQSEDRPTAAAAANQSGVPKPCTVSGSGPCGCGVTLGVQARPRCRRMIV